MNSSEMAEIKDLFQETNELLRKLLRDVNYIRRVLKQMNERLASLETRMIALDGRMLSVCERMDRFEV